MKKKDTKQKVAHAAVLLFNNKGYDGTSVREIAKKADVNPALISYYFGSKNGLLEFLMTQYLEGYVGIMEEIYHNRADVSPRECLIEIVAGIMDYQQNHHHLTRFAHREISMDTVLIREVMTTYLSKEKYFFKSVLEKGMETGHFRNLPIPTTIMQLKGMLSMPYLNPQYVMEVLHVYPHEKYFNKVYVSEMVSWIDGTLSDRKKPGTFSLLSAAGGEG